MRTIGWMRGGLVALACLVAAPASADIKSFNAAMQKGDFKAAAEAAASAWPGLDKSRKDLAVIAREFGFAAYLAGDYAAAKTYGEAAVAASEAAGEPTALRTGSELTLRLAEYRLSPAKESRDRLFAALQVRVQDPTIDPLSYTSASVVTIHDFDAGDWRATMESAAMAEKLTAARGSAYDAPHFRFALVGAAARYMASRDMDAYRNVGALERRIIAAIAAAPDNRPVDDLEEVYRETNAWQVTISSHLKALRRMRDERKSETEWAAYVKTPEYIKAMSRITTRLPEGACFVRISETSPEPRYPSAALFKGMIGTIILKMDVDNEGKAHNARVVAAVPARHFAETALKNTTKLTFRPVDGSPAGCTMAQTGKVVTYQFMMP